MEIKQKLFYKIGEVCQLIGIQSHVLRYWETEFTFLRPTKNSAGQRVYRYKDILLIEQIRKLLYEEGYTISGAKKKIREIITEQDSGSNGKDKTKSSNLIAKIRDELLEILSVIKKWPAE